VTSPAARRALAACLTAGLAVITAGIGDRLDARALEAVDVLVAVSDDLGRPVTSLAADDFEITCDGAPAAIASVRPGPGPVSIALIFDVSFSANQELLFGMGLSRQNPIDGLKRSLLPALDARDLVRVVRAGRRIVIGAETAPADPKLIDDLERVFSEPPAMRTGPSPIWDAVDDAVRALGGSGGRRGVLLVSDGRASGNRLGMLDALQHAVEAGIVVSVLGLGGEIVIPQGRAAGGGMTAVRVRPEALIRQLAEDSGGLHVGHPRPVTGVPSPGPILARMVTGLRMMYTLGVTPPAAGGRFHRLEVRVRQPGLTVRAPRVLVSGRGQGL
jgi:hypothetical protein